MLDTKGLLASKTTWGVIIAGLALVAQLFGWTVDAEGQATALDAVAKIADAVGLLLALWGRITAKKTISGIV